MQIKIVSNPYNRSLQYLTYSNKGILPKWEDITQDSINSRLREKDERKIFLPFKIKEIIDTIISEYYVGSEKINIIFEGTADEYSEVENVCMADEVKDKIILSRSERFLENARDILDHAKTSFETVNPIIRKIVSDDVQTEKDLNKVSDALNDIIPVCIFGNYSAGKSTFINSLIGYELLPSGGDPVTSKIYEIKRSKYNQIDRAEISFSYRNESFELSFDNKECRVTLGDRDNELIQEIISRLKEADDLDLFKMVRISVDVLNFFEKKDKNDVVIGDIIRIRVPFSENGKLGQSHNEFVIFDTPGSNSNTNMDHKKVLVDSLEGFSNGIPVWVSAYDSIDSVDNATLCDLINHIEALDKRFTMIVINKADSVQLPANGFKREEITNILEFESVEKMYSSGIYFVSSVMGLGAKNPDGIVSDYLLEVYDEKERKFSDPSARAYKKLYEYNIMPEQVKQKAIKYSQECPNLIYANSGTYCVEMEMEQFASKYAAYNKCQMVYNFLSKIIDETEKRIEATTATLEKDKQKREQELDEKKKELIEEVNNNTQALNKKFERESHSFMQQYVKNELKYELTLETLESDDETINKGNEEHVNYARYQQDYDDARDNRFKNFTDNLSELFSMDTLTNGIKDKFKTLTEDWSKDSQMMQEKKDRKDETRKKIDEATSNRIMVEVREKYQNSILDSQNRLINTARDHWQEKSQEYREAMIHIITESETLSEQQQNELSKIIIDYPPFEHDDDADKVFIKDKFLRRSLFDSRFERVNIRRLSSSYNSSMRHNINDMSERLNESFFISFKVWQSKLQNVIEENISTYNPNLREISEMIRIDMDNILELKANKKAVSDSFKTIETMMSWKEPVKE